MCKPAQPPFRFLRAQSQSSTLLKRLLCLYFFVVDFFVFPTTPPFGDLSACPCSKYDDSVFDRASHASFLAGT
jgi:hypothetical protein